MRTFQFVSAKAVRFDTNIFKSKILGIIAFQLINTLN